jgi:predicted DNA-binding antitoxin AbrB/MazE fold protein
MVQFNAHYDGNVIKPDEPVDLQVGQRLRVTIVDAVADPGQPVNANALEQLKAFAKECEVDGPADFAENHDFYAHGRPLP